MKNLDPKDIIFEDYNEVTPEKYAMYYTQDTMMIVHGAHLPHYFVRKDAVGTKEKMKEELGTKTRYIYRTIQSLLASQETPAEKIRTEIEKLFLLRQKYIQVYFPELDDLITNLTPLRKTLNGG